MSQAHAQAHGDDSDHLALRERPILLADIDEVLAAAADVAHAGPDAPVRAWRDALTLALESLAYAQSVLAADAAILRHCLSAGGSDAQALVDALPTVITSRPRGDGWSAPNSSENPSGADPWVFVGSDELMPAHRAMARVDLSSPEDVRRVLGLVEEQLAPIRERLEAVEIRLAQIRAAILRQYREGVVPNWST